MSRYRTTGNDQLPGASEIRRLVKAAITSGIFASAGSKQNYRLAEQFVQLFRDQTKLKNMVGFFSFEGDTAELDTFDFPYRVLYPQTEQTDHTLRRSPTMTRPQLSPVRFNAKALITDEAIDTNIAGRTIIDLTIDVLAKAVMRDFEKLAIHGDEDGPLTNEDKDDTGYAASKYQVDQVYKQIDGLIALAIASGTTLDVSGYTNKYFNHEIARQMVLALPENKKPYQSEMSFFANSNAYSDYWDTAYDAGTDSAKDKASTGRIQLMFQNLPIEEIPLMENYPRKVTSSAFSASGGTIALTYPPVSSTTDVITLANIGSTYTTPYVRDTDYSINNTTGIVTHDAGGSMTYTNTFNVTYRGSDNVVLMRPGNFQLGVKKDNMRVETDRVVDNAYDLVVIRTSIDALLIDPTAVVIATGMVNKTAGS